MLSFFLSFFLGRSKVRDKQFRLDFSFRFNFQFVQGVLNLIFEFSLNSGYYRFLFFFFGNNLEVTRVRGKKF